MSSRLVKSLRLLTFGLVVLFISNTSLANETKHEEEKINPAKIIIEHVSDAHDFHFFNINEKPVTIPLPVILYNPEKGLSCFMSSAFHHGHEAHDGYMLYTEHFAKEHHLEDVKDAKGQLLYKEGQIYTVGADGLPDLNSKVYDLSLTKNVVQNILSMILLVWLMIGVAKHYKNGQGVKTAPKGFQNAIEPVITFVRDEVAKPNLGHKYQRFMPLLLTIFFVILINNIIGLIPGSANVSGNIAFTAMLGLISFIVILINTNKHFWAHIFNPPVPMGVKFIMVPVEILGIFTKPFALIIRLFANMISGHIIILSFICLIFVFGAMNTALGWGTSPFFILLSVFIYLIEVLVAFIQAFIFANLTAVFIGQAFEGEHHHEEAAHH
ncbi:MAG: F0F1 ATP synthase subunit A [Chitinophagaceae bacterium]|nr:F0F1 ATP synthase subunit A [Chitinophagaceae bacterium]